MNKNVIIIVIVVAVIGGGVFFWLQREGTEEAIETSIEKATNGAVDVDIDDETITVNTNAGSFSAGEEVDLPDNFPSDIHVIDGTIKMVSETPEIEGFSVSIETSKSVSAAKTEYEEELVDDGWTITGTLDFTETVSLMAEKDNRTVTVTIMEVDGVVTVGIGTSTNEE